ncbi:hypothetical protein Tco_1519186 [Tanacetum coccineum]
MVDNITPTWVVRLLKKAKTKIARRDQKIQAREEEIKKLDKEIRSFRTMEMEAKSVDLAGELESLRVQFFDLKVNNHQLSQQGMSEGLKYGVGHGEAKLDLAIIKAYDPEVEAKYVAALTALRDLKYLLVGQLEKLRDAPIDLLMTSLHLESDFGEDAPEWISELHFSTSQLKIPIYPEVRDLRDPWVGSAHHARSDGILVSTPTVAPQGLAILLADAAVQTEASKDEASPPLLRSKSLPPMYNLDWP